MRDSELGQRTQSGRVGWRSIMIAVVVCCATIMAFLFGRRQLLGEDLIYAASNGDAARVRGLISQGISPVMRNHDGQSLLAMAINGRHYEVVEVLMDAGASPDLPEPQGGTPALMVMGELAEPALIIAVVKRSRYPEIRQKGMQRAFSVAIHRRKPEWLRKIDYDLIDIDAPLDGYSYSGLAFAAKLGDEMLVRTLLSLGATPHASGVNP